MADINLRPALVVDGLSIFHSCAGPAARLTNGYTYSFVVSLTSAMKKINPKGVFVCWDSRSKRRTEILPTYKGDRVPSMNDVKRQYLEQVKQFLRVAGVDQFYAEGYEADDIGAFFANTLESSVLLSNDKDWIQLVRPGVSVFTKIRREGLKTEKKLITWENFPLLVGHNNPEEFVRFLCANGDAVDCIDGVRGIGPDVIKAYLLGMKVGEQKKRSLDEFFAGSAKFLKNLSLIELRNIREIPGLQADFGKLDEGALQGLLEELTFASMLKNFSNWVQPYRDANADLSTIS